MSDSAAQSISPLVQGDPSHFDLDAPTHRSPPTIIATPSIPALESGNVVDFGDYELIDEIARGGMGVVYRARQKSLSRP